MSRKRISWERFARARAQLEAGVGRDAVLAEANVDAATWMAEEESLLVELADDVERANFTTIEAYRGAYRTTAHWMKPLQRRDDWGSFRRG